VAAGDVYNIAPASVANAAYMTMQPAGTVEAVIHNILVPEGTAWSLHAYDGTDDILIGRYVTSLFNMQLHTTNGSYYRALNDSGAAAIMSVDGIVTHA